MEQSPSMLLSSLIGAWGFVTAILIVLVIYRGTLSGKQDFQVVMAAPEQHHYQEQQEISAKMSRLRVSIIGLAVLAGMLLLSSAGVWFYQGWRSF
jgi:hypothetical protein